MSAPHQHVADVARRYHRYRALLNQHREPGVAPDLNRWADIVGVQLTLPASLPLVRMQAPEAPKTLDESQGTPGPDSGQQEPSQRSLCRHCGFKVCCRPRGLCWNCYYTPEIRDQYTSTSKFGRRGVGQDGGRHVAASTPTDALPGSPEKVAIMIARCANRESLFHPQDVAGERPSAPDHGHRRFGFQRRFAGPSDLSHIESDRSDIAVLINLF